MKFEFVLISPSCGQLHMQWAGHVKLLDGRDVNLDFDTPHDYVEPPPKPPSPKNVKVNNYVTERNSSENTKLQGFKTTKDFVPFSGTGYVLGSK